MLELAMTFFDYLVASLRSDYGSSITIGISAALAAAGLLCIGLLAWLVHPETKVLAESSAETA